MFAVASTGHGFILYLPWTRLYYDCIGCRCNGAHGRACGSDKEEVAQAHVHGLALLGAGSASQARTSLSKAISW